MCGQRIGGVGILLALAVVLLSTAVYGRDSSLVLYFSFDDVTAGQVKDLSQYGNNGRVDGNPVVTTGKFGQALLFDATNDQVVVPTNATLEIEKQITLMIWAKPGPNLTADWRTLLGKSPTSTLGNNTFCYDIRTDNTGQLRFSLNMGGTWRYVMGPTITQDTWYHVTGTYDGVQMVFYVNGESVGTLATTGSIRVTTDPLCVGNIVSATGAVQNEYWSGVLDEVRLWNRALGQAEVKTNMLQGQKEVVGAGLAYEPGPANRATDVLRDTVVTWKAGEFAQTHDVYFGTVFADVNSASRTSPKGTLVSQGRADTTFNPGRLQFGQTYYWRVDEVNAPPTSTIFKGEVWNFTVEPVAYPLGSQAITATASSAAAGQGPENTLSSAGLTDDLQGNDLATMWLSAPGATGPACIRYDFAQPIELHEMWVWNHNGLLESMLGFGAKDVVIEYSPEGTTFQPLGTTHEFARAPGQAGYAHNTVIAFGDVAVKSVKLTIQNNWGGLLAQYGLSKVRFFYVPVVARQPSPASGTADIAPRATLNWRAGREAGSHQVFLGTDPNSLALTATVQQPSYQADLNLGQTYYWKVVEVNQAKDPATWSSDIWNFSTPKFLVVEDFESYTDDEGQAIWQTWIDGYGIAANGSQVGNAAPPYAERTIILGGKQAMPLFYSNTAGASYSEAERTLDPPQDWTKYGCKTLALSFYGDPNNTGQLYLKINSTKILYNGKPEDLKRAQWQPWNINLAASGANLKSVTKIAIGIDGAGAAGVFRFDNLRLYPLVGAMVTPSDPDKTGLVAWYKFDGDFKDSAGTYTATPMGDAKIASDPVRGQVVSLDGTGDGVAVPLLGSGNTLTIAMWVNTAVDPVPIQFESFFHANGWEAKDLHWRYSYGKVNAGINGGPAGLTGLSIAKINQWNHVAVTVSATELALWLNGLKEASVALATPVAVTLGEGTIGAWLGTDGKTVSRGFTGTIDDARFYNRALTAEEIGFLAGRTTPFAQSF